MKFNRKTHEKERIINLIEKFYEEDNLELEAIINGDGSQHKLNYHNFVDIYQRLLAEPDLAEVKPRDVLNIYFDPKSKFSNIRVTILGEGSIKNYCSTNSIKNIGYNVKFLKKENFFLDDNKIGRVDVTDYNVRFNLKIEKEMDSEDKLIKELKSNWNEIPKSFRRKQIHTFVTNSGLFNFDLSIVKKSNTINENMTVEEVIAKRMQHLIIKPRDVKESFYDWWTQIKKDKKNKVDVGMQSAFYKKLENSNVLTNPENFEIEIEMNRLDQISLDTQTQSGGAKKSKNDIVSIFNKYVEKIGIVLQAVQGSNYIIGETEKQEVIKEYQSLIDNQSNNLFKGPLPLTLELKHVKQYSNRDYTNPDLETIRVDYLVTEKANGERSLLYIAKNSKMYLITRSGKDSEAVKYTGCQMKGHGETLLDGEFITVDLKGNSISTYLFFDVYYYKGKDIRDLPLGYHEKQNNTRQSIMFQIDNMTKDNDVFVSHDKLNQFALYRKKYLRGDISSSKGLNPDESNNDTMIFDSCQKLLSRMDKIFGGLLDNGHLYSYETDGLIFVPANLGVGQNFKDDNVGVFGKKIWQRVYKWKPPKFNSIDFYVKIRRNIIDKEVVDEYYNGNRHKHVFLQVSYHPEYHDEYYAQKILNENINRPSVEQYVNFEPINPFHGYIDANGQLINNIQIASIPTNNEGDLLTMEGEIIQEGNVIEFIYDDNEAEERFKWKPLRIRENKKANGFHTAANIWRSLNNKVTTEIITTGKCPENTEYQGLKGQFDKLTKPLKGFNNYVKNKLLQIATEDISDVSLLDLCCGKIVGMKSWKFNKVKFAVAIDNNPDNIHNHIDGAAVRIIKHAQNDVDLRKLSKNTMLIYGDCGKNISNGEAAADLLNKYYLDVLYGNHEISGVNPKLEKLWGKAKNKFDVVTCSFGIQHFFKDLETIENFMVNIAENLKSDGKFVGICLDGEKLFNELKNSEKIQGFSNKNLLWTITRNYQPTATYPKNHYSLGYQVTTDIDSVMHNSKGYLVHFDFLTDMMNKYGLKLLDTKMFDEKPMSFLESFKGDYPKLSEVLTKTTDLKSLASMQRWFIFVKTKNKAVGSMARSSLSSGLFDVSASSSSINSKENMDEPEPLSESVSEKILPEDIDYEDEKSEASEYKSDMSYDYDDSIPDKSKTQKKSSKSILEEKNGKASKKVTDISKNKSKLKTQSKPTLVESNLDQMEIHKPNVTIEIVKKDSKNKSKSNKN
jgi:hypothetical protein